MAKRHVNRTFPAVDVVLVQLQKRKYESDQKEEVEIDD